MWDVLALFDNKEIRLSSDSWVDCMKLPSGSINRGTWLSLLINLLCMLFTVLDPNRHAPSVMYLFATVHPVQGC